MARISVYYWAGAKAAAGVEMDSFDCESVAAALQSARDARADSRFDRVLSVSSVLVDGVVAHRSTLDDSVVGDVRVEILPPFAGGASEQSHIADLRARDSTDPTAFLNS